MSVSPKVSAATVGASLTTVVVGILGPHVFPHGMAPDVQGLVAAVLTAAVTFGSGYLARHDAEVTNIVNKVEAKAEAADVVYTKVRQAVADVPPLVAEQVVTTPPPAQALPVSHPLA